MNAGLKCCWPPPTPCRTVPSQGQEQALLAHCSAKGPLLPGSSATFQQNQQRHGEKASPGQPAILPARTTGHSARAKVRAAHTLYLDRSIRKEL